MNATRATRFGLSTACPTKSKRLTSSIGSGHEAFELRHPRHWRLCRQASQPASGGCSEELAAWLPVVRLSQRRQREACAMKLSGYTAEDRERWRAEILEAKRTMSQEEFQ